MNSQTNVKVIGVAAALTTVFMWLSTHFAPGLMADAPTGLEAAITGLFSVLVGYIKNSDKPNTRVL